MSEETPAERTLREERSLTPMRTTIADRLQESYQEAVHVTASRTVGADTLLSAAETASPDHDGGPDPSVVDVFICALSDTLEAHPAFNATFEIGRASCRERVYSGV
jgi:pyruvate dehydrogenase E2 component (dihydrolipoamide acetyltransferase)